MKDNVVDNKNVMGLVEQQKRLGRARNTISVMINSFRRVSDFVDFNSLESIDRKQAQEIVMKLSEKGYSNSTIKLTRTFINELYDYMELDSPFKGTKLPSKKKNSKKDTFDFFTLDEVKLILEKAMSQKSKNAKRDYAILKLMFNTGIRKSEVLSLNVKDVDFDNSTIKLSNTKREEYVEIAVGKNALLSLSEYLDTRSDNLEPLFISSYNTRISTSGIDCIIKKVYKMAGLENTIHATRHTTASLLADMNMSLTDIQERLRHSSSQTTLKYISQSQSRRRDVSNAFDI